MSPILLCIHECYVTPTVALSFHHTQGLVRWAMCCNPLCYFVKGRTWAPHALGLWLHMQQQFLPLWCLCLHGEFQSRWERQWEALMTANISNMGIAWFFVSCLKCKYQVRIIFYWVLFQLAKMNGSKGKYIAHVDKPSLLPSAFWLLLCEGVSSPFVPEKKTHQVWLWLLT